MRFASRGNSFFGAMLLASACVGLAHADTGKLLLTGGVSTIDGAGGGGLVPWAVTSTYASDGQLGASAFATTAATQNYSLAVYGAAVTYHDRVELSYANQDLDTHGTLSPLGLSGLHLRQDIFGVKVKVYGDAILDSDTWVPQVAVGALRKQTYDGVLDSVLTSALGAHLQGTEGYVSATKLLLEPGILLNGTLRLTRANQDGLLGFGSASDNRYHVKPEASAAYLLNSHLAVGAEFKAKPDNLNRTALGTGALKEDAWQDVFVAWAPVKTISLTAAYVNLGQIAPGVQPKRQDGYYLSAQVSF